MRGSGALLNNAITRARKRAVVIVQNNPNKRSRLAEAAFVAEARFLGLATREDQRRLDTVMADVPKRTRVPARAA
jgi:hypothetical protein